MGAQDAKMSVSFRTACLRRTGLSILAVILVVQFAVILRFESFSEKAASGTAGAGAGAGIALQQLLLSRRHVAQVADVPTPTIPSTTTTTTTTTTTRTTTTRTSRSTHPVHSTSKIKNTDDRSTTTVPTSTSPKPIRAPLRYQYATATQSIPTNYYQHAIVVPYRDRQYHLTIFQNYMDEYLKTHFTSSSLSSSSASSASSHQFALWIVEQDDPKLFNRAFLANVALREIIRTSPQTHCVILHDVDLLPQTSIYNHSNNNSNSNSSSKSNTASSPSSPSPPTRPIPVPVPYTTCKYPTHLGSELEHFNYSVPYPTYAGGIATMSLQDWQRINGLSNDYAGWGGEDDDLYHRWRINGMLYQPNPQPNDNNKDDNEQWVYAPIPYRPQTIQIMGTGTRGSGRFRPISQSAEHHVQDKQHDNMQNVWNLLTQLWRNSPRWKTDGLNDLYYTITDATTTLRNNSTATNPTNSSGGITVIHHVKVRAQKSQQPQYSSSRGHKKDGTTTTSNNNTTGALRPVVEFVPIPCIGGMDVQLTNAAAQAKIAWGACHYYPQLLRQQQNYPPATTTTTTYNCSGLNHNDSIDFQHRAIFLRSVTYYSATQEPWYIPLNDFILTPLEGTQRFTIVRHPYERAIEFYRQEYDREHFHHHNDGSATTIQYLKQREDPIRLNDFLQAQLRNQFTNVNFRPQRDYLINSETGKLKRYVQHVLRYEQFDTNIDAFVDMYPHLKELNLNSLKTWWNHHQQQHLRQQQQYESFLTISSLTTETVSLLNVYFKWDFQELKYPKLPIAITNKKLNTSSAITNTTTPSRQQQQQKQPLELLPIPYNGANILTKAATKVGLVWGACHWDASFKDCHRTNKQEHGNVKNGTVNNVNGGGGDLAHGPATMFAMTPHQARSPWNMPPAYLRPNPFQKSTNLVVIRNPYNRAIDYYRNYYDYQHFKKQDTVHDDKIDDIDEYDELYLRQREDPIQLNRFLQKALIQNYRPHQPSLQQAELPAKQILWSKVASHIVRYETMENDVGKLATKLKLPMWMQELQNAIQETWKETKELERQLIQQKTKYWLSISDLEEATVSMLNHHYRSDFQR